MAQFSPQPFGKYYLVDKLAVGGMAEVFLARPPQGGTTSPRYLAIKRILPHFSSNAQFIDMFIDEAKISVQLEHENIVPVFDLGKIGETYFLAMEFVAGQDVKQIVGRCRELGVRLSYEHAAYILSEVLSGLDYAHKKTDRAGKPLNIVHRDVSPQNILVGYDGSVKVTDFGIAKAESKLDSTQVGTLKGKFGYMAPEQVVAGGPPLDHRADLFAAGVILWELITGHRLFHGTSEIEILERVRAAKFDPPSSFVPDVPRELERIVFKSLMKDREKRYASAYEMHVDLVRFLASYAPQFNQAEMAGVMEELFANELALAKSRWNVVIGPIIDRTKVEAGAAAESTRPDQTRISDDVALPQKTRVATPAPTTLSQPPPAARTGRTPPPMPSPSIDFGAPEMPAPPPPPRSAPPPPGSATPAPRRSGQTPPPTANPDAVRRAAPTTIRPPAEPARLRPEDLFDDGSPFDADPDKDPTISKDLGPGSARRPERTAAAPAPEPEQEAPTTTTRMDPGGMAPTYGKAASVGPPPPPPPRRAEPVNTEPVEPARSRKRGRGAVSIGGLFRAAAKGLLVLAAVGGVLVALVKTGVIPNPIAAPTLEVVSTVDAMITIDGNVVLASGRRGVWPVGIGERVVEVKKAGYKPVVRTITVRRGERAYVDATLEPLPDAIADVKVETDPEGAHVFLDDVEQGGVTPLSVHPKLGDHVLRITRDGFADIEQPLHAVQPGDAPGVSLKLVPTAASISVTTDPPGAQVFVDGVKKGKTPLTVDHLAPGKPVVVTLTRPGYAPENRTVTPPGGVEPLGVSVTMTKAGSPKPGATPAGDAVEGDATPAPAGTPVAEFDPNKGYLSIDVPGGWGEVWLDGSVIARKTPLVKAPIAPGTHSVRVVNPLNQREKTFDVTIVAGSTVVKHVPLE